MRKYILYMKYLLIHKYWVMVFCFRYGLYWQGITHDWSKLIPDEFVPYVKHFYGAGHTRDKSGYYKPTDTGDAAFDYSWFLHQKRNKHHWQYWSIPEYDGSVPIEIPSRYLKEMYCDWLGAGKAQGTSGPRLWYEKNKDRMVLHPNSRKWIEEEIDKEEQ